MADLQVMFMCNLFFRSFDWLTVTMKCWRLLSSFLVIQQSDHKYSGNLFSILCSQCEMCKNLQFDKNTTLQNSRLQILWLPQAIVLHNRKWWDRKDTEQISWIFVIRLLNNMDLHADFVAPNFIEALLYTHAPGQMIWNLVRSIYGRSSIEIAHFFFSVNIFY
jgi:hypothetical protein